jgi:hypothetical protein
MPKASQKGKLVLEKTPSCSQASDAAAQEAAGGRMG